MVHIVWKAMVNVAQHIRRSERGDGGLLWTIITCQNLVSSPVRKIKRKEQKIREMVDGSS